MSDKLVLMAEFAKTIGCSRPYVTQLKKDDRLVVDSASGMVWLEASKKKIQETRDPGRRSALNVAPTSNPPAPESPRPASRHPKGSKGNGREHPHQSRSAAPGEAEDHGDSYQAARADRERSLARKARIEADLLEGRLAETSTASLAGAIVGAATRQALETLIGPLSVRLAPIRDEGEIRGVLRDEFERVLNRQADEIASAARRFLGQGSIGGDR